MNQATITPDWRYANFVGVLLGGASPVEAGAAQLLVLVGLLAVETVAVVVTVELVARRLFAWPRS